jgi:hypothetical protein
VAADRHAVVADRLEGSAVADGRSLVQGLAVRRALIFAVRLVIYAIVATWIIMAIKIVCDLISAAHAHDLWADDSPVPPWVKAVCCGPDDVHHLRADQVQIRPDGFHVDGYPETIPIEQALPSMDGDYWIFYRYFPAGGVSRVYCFFVPFTGT